MITRKAVIYARYSAGSGQTDQSIEGQVRECKAYIKQQGFELVGTYADRHITGRTDRRPEFQRMITDAETGKFDVVVVYTTDRFSRSKYDSVVYKKQLKDLGVQICYAAENIPDGPEGILLEALMEGWAQYYSEELSRKIRRGMHDSASKCKATGSTPPLGYKVNSDGYYEIDEETAPHVLHSFEMYANGSRFTDIIKYLDLHGIRTGKGNSFSGQAVKRMLTNRRYMGEYHWHDVTVKDGMPVIVPKSLFFSVQKKIKSDHPPKHRCNEYYLSGKFVCGLCQSNYKGISGRSKTGAKHLYYKCGNKKCDAPSIPARKFEAFIADEVSAALREPEMLDFISTKLFDYGKEMGADEDTAKSLKKRLSKVEKELDALVYNLTQRPGSDAMFKKLDELEAEKEALELEIDAMDESRTVQSTFTKEALQDGIQAFLEGFSFDDADNMVKRILDGFVRRVVKTNEKILIELNLTGVEPLELEDLLEFDQRSDWWSNSSFGRTLYCGPGVVLVVSYAA